MKTEIIRRTFEASKHPKGSKERELLNEKAETSEYMPSQKYIARIYYPQTDTHFAYVSDRPFRTKLEAADYLDGKEMMEDIKEINKSLDTN